MSKIQAFYRISGALTALALALASSSCLQIVDNMPGGSAACQGTTGAICTLWGHKIDNPDGKLATSVYIGTATKMAYDHSGNIVILDGNLHYIYKVDKATNVIHVIAGNGTKNPAVEGASAYGTPFSTFREGLAIDSHDNIYFSEEQSYRVLKIDSASGLISRAAGTGVAGSSSDPAASTPATSYSLVGPMGLAIDSSDNLYIADPSNHRVFKVDHSTQFITTYAGNGTASNNCTGTTSATLSYPWQLSIDPNNQDLLVSSYFNIVCKVPSGHPLELDPFIGTGANGDTGDGGAATSATLGYATVTYVDTSVPSNTYVASNNRVRKVTSGVISAVVGTTQAGYSADGTTALGSPVTYPWSLLVDPLGEVIYGGAYLVQKVGTDAKIHTVVGGIPNQYLSGPTDFANDWSVGGGEPGYTYISPDRTKAIFPISSTGYGVRIVQLDIPSGTFSFLAGTGTNGNNGDGPVLSAELSSNPGVVSMYNGDIYYADFGNYAVRKISNGQITTIAGTLGSAGGNGDIGFGDGGPATSAKFGYLFDMKVDPSTGDVYVADRWELRKFHEGGTISNFFQDGSNEIDSFVVQGGFVYVADRGGTFWKIPTSGGAGTVIAGIDTPWGYSGDGGPMLSAALSSNPIYWFGGNLFQFDWNMDAVRKYDFTSGNVVRIAGLPGVEADMPDGYIPSNSSPVSGFSAAGVSGDGSAYFWDSQRLRVWVRGLAQ